MKKILNLILVTAFLNNSTWAQCDTLSINNTLWTVQSVDSEELTGEGANNGHAIHCIDNDTTTFWHTQWQNAQPGFPHEIVINLGAVYPVNGFSIQTRHNSGAGKIDAYEFYLSNDGVSWGTAQSKGNFLYDNPSGNAQKSFQYFGAVNTQYVKLVALTSKTNNYYIVTADLKVYQDSSCGASGQLNQLIDFNSISEKITTDSPFSATATSNSGLPITFEIVSGPASVVGNTITLNGTAGVVTIKAKQVGDANYYSAESTQTFPVYDLTTYYPTIQTKLTENKPLEMPNLYAYPIYSNATIDLPQFLTITNIEYEVGGNIITATNTNGYYQGFWTPSSYGSHDVIVRAFASNGNVQEDTLTIQVSNSIADQNVQTFSNNLVNFTGSEASRWFYGSYELPQFVGAYDTIIANFSVTCPAVAGGCDDWDRLAYVEYKAPDGNWYELFRYITPYGVACNHKIDVTDYASLLQGKIELRMFIDTWGSGGWNLHLNFNYKSGVPPYLYSSISELWHGDYSFGNPLNLQPCDTLTYAHPAGTQNAKLRVTTSGHGWGNNNTGNAAEFYHAYHNFLLNGTSVYTQDLWTICNPNPDGCTGQQGTWQYSRAGWCPGTIARPHTKDMSSYISSTPYELIYQFQPSYVDNCHPNNPNCVSGTTCNDCNDSYNPFYRVGAYMINFSNNPIDGTTQIKENITSAITMDIYPNPTKEKFRLQIAENIGECTVEIKNVSGETCRTYFFKNSSDVNKFLFDVSPLSKGMYFIYLKTKQQASATKVVIE
ncbi:MAG: discoidin domain-containing protein [Flavobacteriales bacterium]|nr:discoidin domain-containing protein [Flavobacteriales bacterium]